MMVYLRGSSVLVLCLSFLAVSPSLLSETTRQEKVKKTPARAARTDHDGVPLPEGVLVRLGSIRLRHGADVHQIAFTSDGTNIVSCGADGSVQIWDAASGKRRRQFQAARAIDPTAHGSSFAILSRDGRLLATILQAKDGKTDKVVLWQTATGKICGEVKGEGLFSQLSSDNLAFSADGKILAIGNANGVLRLVETSTGRERRSLRWGEGEIKAVAFSADGKMLAAASSTAGAAVWNVADGTRLRIFLSPEKERMAALVFAPDGKSLVIGSEQGTLHLWDLATGNNLHTLRDDKRGTPLSSLFLLFSPDGSLLVMGDIYNEDLLLWNTVSGKVARKIGGIAEPHCAAFAPDGKTLATGDSANRVRLWDVASGKEQNLHRDNTVALAAPALSPDGRILATYGDDQTLRLWAFPSGKHLRTFRGHDSGVLCLAFTADGKQLITGGYDGTIRFHDTVTGRERRKIEAHGRSENGKREARAVAAIALSPDGKTLASGGFDSCVRLWDIASGKQRHVLEGRRGWVFSVAFSPDGKTVAGGGATDDACDTCLWDSATGKLVRKFEEDGAMAQTLAFSPDGKVLVAAGELLGSWHIDFVETATGKALGGFDNFKTGVLDSATTSAISSDGRILAVGGYRGVTLWEMASRRRIRHLRGAWGGCSDLGLTPDGRTLIAANGDGTIHFWDLTGRADGDRLRTEKLSAKQLEELWTRLDSADPAPAYRAFWELAAAPEDAVAYLRSRLHPTAPLNRQQISRLITDLGSEQFAVRDKATKELAELREVALPALRAALAARPELEQRKRLEQLVREAENEMAAPGRLHLWRTLAALEQMRTPPARKLLETLATGTPEAWLTRQAKASLQRVAKQSAAKP